MKQRWQVRLTDRAQSDYSEIVRWTAEHFGVRQARNYATTLRRALKALGEGPSLIGLRSRSELGQDVATLHVARKGRKGRHLLVLRIREQDGVIEVLRILHDSMDLTRHLDA
jgi:toxin ParE1/3/4